MRNLADDLSGIILVFILTVSALGMTGMAARPFEESPSLFGVRVGVGYNVPNTLDESNPNDDLSPGVALSVGATYDFQFLTLWDSDTRFGFHLHSGLGLHYDTYGMKDPVYRKCSVRKLGCVIPVGLGFTYCFEKVSLQLNVGPALAIGMGGWMKGREKPLRPGEGWVNYYTLTGTSRVDVLLNANIGIHFSQWYAGLNPTIGLKKCYDITHTGFHDLSMRLIFGRTF